MSIVNSSKAGLGYLIGAKPLRYAVYVVTALLLLYAALSYTLVPYFLSELLKNNYGQVTGHQLQLGEVKFDPFEARLTIHHLKDSATLWQAQNITIDVELMQSIWQSALVVRGVNVQQLVANLKQDESGLWNFDDVLKHVAAADKKAVEKKSSAKNTPVLIRSVVISNAAIHSNVLALNNLSLAIEPLSVTLKNIDLRGKSLAALSLSAKINKFSSLNITGTIDLQSFQSELDLDITSIPFTWFNASLTPYVALEVLDGFIDTQSHLSIAANGQKNILTSGALRDLKLRPANVEQDVIKWKNLSWRAAAIAIDEKSAKFPLVSLDEFDGQFIIHKDRTNNLQAILLKSTVADSTPSTASGAVANPPENAVASWRFAIDRVAINNAAIGFYDQSLTPSFMVIVQQFSGDILNIASDEQQVAKINLSGNVDGTSPVRLSGEMMPFMALPQADVLLSLEKIDMGSLSPYSAEYAGWRIKKGLLSVDLHYRYEKGLILGKNHVVIDRLVFGEKIRSPRAIDIPLRLGLALLTDENGIAILDAEISGDPKSPAFNVGALVIRVLRNTFKKIISSPFKFLSSLIHSDEDLGRVEFSYGESQLGEQSINKLKLLNEALKKRPAMHLNIQGIYDVVTDTKALQEEQLKSELQKQGLTAEDIRSRGVVWQKMLTNYYQSQGLNNIGATLQGMFHELAALQTVSPERLAKLAHERALAVKQHMVLQLGIASDKLLLMSDVNCVLSRKCSGSAAIFTLEN